MSSPNPWEKLKLHASEVVPPIVVLREQAGLLTEATEGMIQGTVRSEQSGVHVIHTLAAVVPSMNLVTWNFAHIANAAVRGKIEGACRTAGLRAPIICTPEELMEA